MKKDYDNSYHIANVNENEKDLIKQAETKLKQQTGKDYYIIVWEKE